MALFGVVDEGVEAIKVLAGGEELRGPDAEMGARDAGENASFFRCFALDEFPAFDRGEGTGGGDAEGVHRFRNEIFTNDGAEGGAAIAAT